MQLANPLRIGTFSLVAILLTQTATAHWLDRLLQPAAFEELTAPANGPQDTELPPPESLPPATSDESVLEPPELSDEVSPSPYEQSPYDAERPLAQPAPLPSQRGEAWPLPGWTSPRFQHGPGSHAGFDADGLRSVHRNAPDPNVCCEAPRIKYWNHPLLAEEVCSCHQSEELTVLLTVPTDCCSVEVPVCVTACCDSVPEYESSRDLLGRKTHEYCWPCGQRIKIVDRHTGTLVVHTFQCE